MEEFHRQEKRSPEVTPPRLKVPFQGSLRLILHSPADDILDHFLGLGGREAVDEALEMHKEDAEEGRRGRRGRGEGEGEEGIGGGASGGAAQTNKFG